MPHCTNVPSCVLVTNLRSRMSSIMRRRSGEIFSGESFMALLRLRYEAECLTSQHTKQNLRGQPIANLRSKPPLPRERFSPATLTRLSQMTALLTLIVRITWGAGAANS